MTLSVAIVGSGPAGFYTADALLKRRAATARSGDLTRYLDRAPDMPPVPGDEMPDDASS